MKVKAIAAGDVVYLRSSTIAMTVRLVVDQRSSRFQELEPGIHCDWIDKNGCLQRAVFVAEQLRKLGDSPIGGISQQAGKAHT